VFDVGDPSDRIWFLKEGCLVLDAPFGRLTLDKPGEVVGEVCTFRNVPRTHAARTVTETSMYALLKRDIEEVFELDWLAVTHCTALHARARIRCSSGIRSSCKSCCGWSRKARPSSTTTSSTTWAAPPPR
jgi:CRP-like cAMP-binding protein